MRRWREGDRIEPFGMKGSRLVSDIFSDAKLSLDDKRKVWLLTRDDIILWVEIQHLYAYGCKDDLPKGETIVDPRFSYVKRGSAKTWEKLNGRSQSIIRQGTKHYAYCKGNDLCLIILFFNKSHYSISLR